MQGLGPSAGSKRFSEGPIKQDFQSSETGDKFNYEAEMFHVL